SEWRKTNDQNPHPWEVPTHDILNAQLQAVCACFFFFMLRRPPRSTLFPTRRSSDLEGAGREPGARGGQGLDGGKVPARSRTPDQDRKSTRLNSSHVATSYAVFCLKKKKINILP